MATVVIRIIVVVAVVIVQLDLAASASASATRTSAFLSSRRPQHPSRHHCHYRARKCAVSLSSSTEDSAFSHSLDSSQFPAATQVQKASQWTTRDGRIILVDVENVRGKSGFGLSHAEIQHAMTVWTRIHQFSGQVSLVVDHGSEESAYFLDEAQLAVVFSGPSSKADDVIAHDVAYLMSQTNQEQEQEEVTNGTTSSGNHIIVVTADRGLIDRCRRASSRSHLTILSPLTLLEDLDHILTDVPMPFQLEQDATNDADDETNLVQDSQDTTSVSVEPQIKALEHEIKLGAELLEAEALLRNKAGVNNKRRGKLKSKVRSLREKLNKQGSLLDQVVNNVLRQGPQKALNGHVLSSTQQSALLARWQKVRSKSQRKERTGDRVILAEQWRRQLEQQGTKRATTTTDINNSLAWIHAQKYSCSPQQQSVQNLEGAETLRLVVISDTHGFEESLTKDEPLPSGDVLLHLGDFAMDGSQKHYSVARFDEWLSKHAAHFAQVIVVRGNHDPKIWYPVQSGATFINKPTTMMIGNFVFAFVPYLSGGALSNRLMPRRCHVMCTHVPPYQLLDRCYSGKPVGSSSLRRGVERMATKSQHPPALWLCGHIHEGRGAVRHAFGGQASASSGDCCETLVLNAANANLGIAKRLDYGPVVLQVNMDETKGKRRGANAEIISMENQHEYLNKREKGFFDTAISNDEEVERSSTELLLAVDLGLRTGFTLYSDEGKLLFYENLEYKSRDDLKIGALSLMKSWEERFALLQNQKGQITHIAVEGADVSLRQVWQEIVDEDVTIRRPRILWVRPEEWRADLLHGKEKNSGERSKEAARLIARQLVADFGGRLHVGKFPTDVAESVLVGYHVGRRLGWINREPAVLRYTNGKVVVPKDVKPPSARAVQEPILL